MNNYLSIAIVTRNRTDSLERTLTSLAKQKIKPFEIIISDDSDKETEIKSNRSLAEKFGCQYIRGPQKGLYANRNFVAKHCNGTHIRTMDDDHEFPENHLEACIAAIEKDNQTIWTIGEYYPWDKERPLPAPIPGQLHPRGFSYTPKVLDKYYGISCGASIYPRTVIDNNVLNLEIYKFGILYLEYGARLLKKGFRIHPLHTTYVIHNYDENNRSESSKQIINSARVFAMLMLSFYHQKSLRNQFLTVIQLAKDIFIQKVSLRLALEAYHMTRKVSEGLA